MDNQRGTNEGLRELALFAGAGGGILGGKLLGWRTVCAVEYEPYAASVLAMRQNDGILEPFPIWDDVRTFNGRPWRGRVDVVSGGFPCTDISAAGKGAGINGEQSGLWREMARIIREVRPRFAFVENSPVLTSRGLGRVLGDLAEMGYNTRRGVIGAEHAIAYLGDRCADHERKRIWIIASMADPCRGRFSQSEEREDQQPRRAEVVGSGNEIPDSDGSRESQQEGRFEGQRRRALDFCEEISNTQESRSQVPRGRIGEESKHSGPPDAAWWTIEPALDRMAHGVPNRVDRIKALGNAQVPAVAALAWQILREGD